MMLAERLRRGAERLRNGLGLPAGEARVVQVLGLGLGARLLVVEFAGRRLLVGQSRAGLARLAEAGDEP